MLLILRIQHKVASVWKEWSLVSPSHIDMTVSLLDCQPQADYVTHTPLPYLCRFGYASLCAGEASLRVAGNWERRKEPAGRAYLQILVGVSRELGAVHI